METTPIYFLIFQKVGENMGKFVCIVDREIVAIDFCKHNKDYYYMANYDLYN